MTADHVTTELDIARAVASGELPSPTAFGNSKYFKLRISGTGVAWRNKHQEYVLRQRSIWCAPEMAARVGAGLPVIAEHPPGKGTLDGPSFFERIVGICVLGFVEGDELWAVCRVIDDHAAKVLASGFFTTSPSVVFGDADQNVFLKIGDEDLLIEGVPSFLDHVALVDTSTGNSGVWDHSKDGTDLGLEISEPEKETTNG
jgi:colicin import membrane protein